MAQHVGSLSRQLLAPLSRTPFVDSAELALILGEPDSTVHRALTDMLADGIVERVSHGTAHLPSSQRYYLTSHGIRETAGALGFATPSDFVRAYPASREWLAVLIRRMDAVAAVYRLAALMSPGTRSRRSHVEFHRRGRFDATITLHDGRDFGVVRQGLALRRRSLYDRLRAIAEYDYTRRPDTVLILVPSVWEERLTGKFCERLNLRDSYIAVETRDALARRDLRLWRNFSWVGSSYNTLKDVSAQGSPGGGPRTESPDRTRASIPRPKRMVEAASAFGLSPSEKRTLDLITDHPMIPREHLGATMTGSEFAMTSSWAHRSVRGGMPVHGSSIMCLRLLWATHWAPSSAHRGPTSTRAAGSGRLVPRRPCAQCHPSRGRHSRVGRPPISISPTLAARPRNTVGECWGV